MRSSNKVPATDFLISRGYDKIDSDLNWLNPTYFDHMIWSQVLTGGNVVRKRMALALSEIFVVSINELDIDWPVQALASYWDLLNKNAFGNFRELLELITLNPAMAVFLDTRGNQKADPTTGRVPDENFAREVMQLFTIGLYELNQDGSQRLSNGAPIETYTNDDVVGLAKVFTGYDFDYSGVSFTPDPRASYRPHVPSAQVVRQSVTADPAKWIPRGRASTHSLDEKRFLGVTIAPGVAPARSLEIALDRLFEHPNVAPFVSRQLIQRLVTSNPSPGYVRRVAAVFADNGKGARGDLGAVFKAIILDDEATSENGLRDPRFGKLREPMLRYSQWGQTFNAQSTSGAWQIRDLSGPSLLNQVPLRAPSVFNFFRPEHIPPRSQAAANNMLAPEFQLVTESSVASYVNFMWSTIDASGFWADDIAADYSYELDIASRPPELLDHLDLVLTGGQLKPETRSLILDALNDVEIESTDDDAGKLSRVRIGIMLTMCSNDYLVQK
ncbi:hypothetical protein FIU90_00505 [Erythrobacter sp. THAF29]|nr:hypothetical protein FIU90_00505 [Erythrobacter sp. THAF29]